MKPMLYVVTIVTSVTVKRQLCVHACVHLYVCICVCMCITCVHVHVCVCVGYSSYNVFAAFVLADLLEAREASGITYSVPVKPRLSNTLGECIH